ncbi:glycosyltransferase [candidate division WOR-3 bacterium]|nr:glycosyltransferase [candidate division WOR-3 bacterium]
MRFLIVNTDYSVFIEDMYRNDPGLKNESFDTQYKARMDSLFGTANFYSMNLKKLGYKAIDIIFNHEYLQKRWVLENGFYKTPKAILNRIPWSRAPILRRYFSTPDIMSEIFKAQVRYYQPDIIYNMAMESVTSPLLNKIRREVGSIKLVIGQSASQISDRMKDLSGYDLILSSLPNQVEYFKENGKPSEYFKLGFESQVLNKLSEREKAYDLSFVGSFSWNHLEGMKTMNDVFANFKNAVIFGCYDNSIDRFPLLKKRITGHAWGLDMYNIYYNSKITFNRHGTIDGNYASSMRLFEATGVGALLLTDYKDNLKDLFEIGKEVVTYKNAKEAVKKIKYYLEHEDEREKIAKAGQKRTLKDHTYYNRMQELVDIVKKYIEYIR